MYRGWLVAVGIVMGTVVPGVAARPQDPATKARPVVEMPRTRFAVGESVFFWVGVNAQDGIPIPRESWTTTLRITWPDGHEQVSPNLWPRDGMIHRGWLGGAGLGTETPQVGRYAVVFEFAGQQTRPYYFTVEDVPVLKDIDAEFVVPSPLVLASPDAAVSLVVRNRSSQTIRFPHRGQMSAFVYVQMNKTSGEWFGSSFMVPIDVLMNAAGVARSNFGEDAFLWKFIDKVPNVSLAPGDTYRLDMPLRSVLTGGYGVRPFPAGEYDLRFSTTIQMLVGESDGPWAEFAPFRIPVNTFAHGRLDR